jgi:type IV secretion system protein VirB11
MKMQSSASVVQPLQPVSVQDLSQQRKLVGLQRDLGPEIMRELADPKVIEVMLNPDGQVWRDRLGEGMSKIGYEMPAAQAEKLLGNIAAMLGTVVTREKPILEGELPLDGSRFEGIWMPVVARPAFAIRKKASLIFTLDDYDKSGILSDKDDERNFELSKRESFVDLVRGMRHADVLRTAVTTRKNILVVGGTGSGKTTLLNALFHAIAELTPDHRIVLIEDTGEIQCAAENLCQMRSNKDATITQLLSATLRLRPDRICVGEVRGPEALALLKLLNTGHPGGVASLHADSPEKGLQRLERLIEENPGIRANKHEIAEAIDIVVFIGKNKNHAAGRKVSEIIVVEGYDERTGRYITTKV